MSASVYNSFVLIYLISVQGKIDCIVAIYMHDASGTCMGRHMLCKNGGGPSMLSVLFGGPIQNDKLINIYM